MAFTDEQFDQRLSPMFRSMKPDRPKSPLNGLLADSQPQMQAPSIPSSAPAAYENQGIQTTPSRAQMLSRPARTEYARTPPPATSPQQVWRSPSMGQMPPITVPPSVTAGLLDNPNAVSAGINATPMTMPPPPAPTGLTDGQDSPPPPEMDVLVPSQQAYSVRTPDYLAPFQYVPLQPTRRYEVI